MKYYIKSVPGVGGALLSVDFVFYAAFILKKVDDPRDVLVNSDLLVLSPGEGKNEDYPDDHSSVNVMKKFSTKVPRNIDKSEFIRVLENWRESAPTRRMKNIIKYSLIIPIGNSANSQVIDLVFDGKNPLLSVSGMDGLEYFK